MHTLKGGYGHGMTHTTEPGQRDSTRFSFHNNIIILVMIIPYIPDICSYDTKSEPPPV